jgi:hypothetical protein
MADGELRFDASDFFRGLRLGDVVVRRAVERGMGQAGLQWLHDAIQEPPTVPIDTGDLRGSGTVFLQGQLLGTSPAQGPNATPATDDDVRPDAGEILVRVGFNKPYAAKWHEVPANFQEPSAGNKYLEAKAAAHGKEYLQTAADVARGEIGG